MFTERQIKILEILKQKPSYKLKNADLSNVDVILSTIPEKNCPHLPKRQR